MKKLIIPLAAVAVLMGLFLAGCGDNDDDDLTLMSTTSTTSYNTTTNGTTSTTLFDNSTDIFNDGILNTENGKISDTTNAITTNPITTTTTVY